MVREAEKRDLNAILELYLYLHEDSIPELKNAKAKHYVEIGIDAEFYYMIKKEE